MRLGEYDGELYVYVVPTLAVYVFLVPSLAVYVYKVPTRAVYVYVVPTLAIYVYVVPWSVPHRTLLAALRTEVLDSEKDLCT